MALQRANTKIPGGMPLGMNTTRLPAASTPNNPDDMRRMRSSHLPPSSPSEAVGGVAIPILGEGTPVSQVSIPRRREPS